MIAQSIPHLTLQLARVGVASVVGVAGVAGVVGCKRSAPKSATSQASQTTLAANVPPGKSLPTYAFRDESVRQKHADVSAFVTQFLETCLTGDYLAYRRLVSRFEKPEPRERFAAIYQGLSSIVVESIEPLDPRRLAHFSRGGGRLAIAQERDTDSGQPVATTGSPAQSAPASGGVANARTRGKPIYLVVSAVELDPAAKVALRHRSRKVAILAFEEEGAWRMAPAPAELQPRDLSNRNEFPSPAPDAEPIPDYPWEQDGDS